MSTGNQNNQLLVNLIDRIAEQIIRLNSSILENESRLAITAQTIFLVKDILLLEKTLPIDFSDIRRHLHFVDYYNEKGDYDMMLSNANDLIHDVKVLQPQIYQYALSEKSKENKKGKKTLTINQIISVTTDKLRSIVRKTPKRETDVQDAMETLFLIKEYDFEREKVSFKYSTKSYQPDFTFEPLDLAIEAKLCNSESDEKHIIDQINADIIGYKTKYANLLFFVYDLGFIRNASKFSQGIEECNTNVNVRVIKH